MRRYDLAHEFLPYLISEINNEKENLKLLINKELFVSKVGNTDNEFDWDEFEIEYRTLNDKISVAIYTFPEPVLGAEAKLGLLFFDNNNKSSYYFTLEKKFSLIDENIDEWIIGLTFYDKKQKNRMNLGDFLEKPDKEIFLFYMNNYILDHNIRIS